MDILGAPVCHKQFGNGEIVGQDTRTVTVRFSSCEKTFLFPSSFDGFLTLADKAQAKKVNKLLADMRKTDEAEKARVEHEEHRRKADEQLALIEKNRILAVKKSASRKKPAKTPQL